MTEQAQQQFPLHVEVAYARPDHQVILPLQVPAGTTARQAVLLSGIDAQFPEIDTHAAVLGIFSRKLDGTLNPQPDEYILQAGDRVEIYRPLLIDPKQARLARAATARKKTDPGGIHER